MSEDLDHFFNQTDRDIQFKLLAENLNTINKNFRSLIQLVETTTSFQLSSLLPCKLTQDALFGSEQTLLASLEQLRHSVERTTLCLGYPPQSDKSPSSLSVETVFNALLPAQEFELSLTHKIVELSMEPDRLDVLLKFLPPFRRFCATLSAQTQHLAYLEDWMLKKPSHGLCLTRTSETFNIVPQTLFNLAQRFECLRDLMSQLMQGGINHKRMTTIQTLIQLIRSREMAPLLTKDGYPVAFIQKDTTRTLCIQTKDGSFFIPTEKLEWNPNTKSFKPTTSLIPVIVDPETHCILQPYRFHGLQQPECVYVTFTDLIQEIQKHLNTTRHILKQYSQS